ncbi:cupin domain-containing protein [Motiliproteus sp.]|uniref:cupin domain-containing protein n=1 Tax=Motiliproteus sp. TaxID=1898955 RepID=UPI003BAA91C8
MTIESVVAFRDQPVPAGPFITPPERLLEGNPLQTIANYFTDDSEKLISGVWESGPGKWQAVSDRNEFCYILSGRVVIADDQGGAKTFTAGDAFVIPKGFQGTWEVLEDARKYYVILSTD